MIMVITPRKAPRVPASPNSLAVAASRRTMLGALAILPAVSIAAPGPACAGLAGHWRANCRALSVLHAPDDEHDGDDPLWCIVSDAETAILNTPAQSPSDIAAKLKVALLHMNTERWAEAALVERDDALLIARSDELDMGERLIIGAIDALLRLGGEA
jgi:hypothetical protein